MEYLEILGFIKPNVGIQDLSDQITTWGELKTVLALVCHNSSSATLVSKLVLVNYRAVTCGNHKTQKNIQKELFLFSCKSRD